MQAARVHIEALLRARRLDRTVTDAGTPPEPVRVAPTGLPWLDPRLVGGWPCGETSEIVGPASSGRTSLLFASLAAATARGDLAALVDTHDTFDAGSAQAASLALDHLLWVRGDPAGVSRPHILLDRAIKAFGLIAGRRLRCRRSTSATSRRRPGRLPFTTYGAACSLRRRPGHRGSCGVDAGGAVPRGHPRAVRLGVTPVWVGSRRSRRLSGSRSRHGSDGARLGLKEDVMFCALVPRGGQPAPAAGAAATGRSPPWPAARRRSRLPGLASWSSTRAA
jgi:hypothetical protein